MLILLNKQAGIIPAAKDNMLAAPATIWNRSTKKPCSSGALQYLLDMADIETYANWPTVKSFNC